MSEPSVDNSALAPAQPRYKHCCDVFDLAPHIRIGTPDGSERWVHYQAPCCPPEVFATLEPEIQDAVKSGAIDTDLQAAIRDGVTAANARDEESAVHAAMPLDATEEIS